MARRGENIRKRKDGRWEARYTVVDPFSGDKKLKSVYAKTYETAKEKLLKLKSGGSENAVGAPPYAQAQEPVFVTDAAEAWLKRVSEGKKQSTYVKYRNIYEKYLFPRFDGIRMDDSVPRLCGEAYRDATVLSDSISKSIYCVINQLLEFCNENYNAGFERVRHRKSHIRNSPVKTLTPAEQAELLKVLYKDMDIYKFGILLCLHTGLRLGELCALNWQDIDITRRLLYVNHTVQRISVINEKEKTRLLEGTPKSVFSYREIPIPDSMIPWLVQFHKQNGYVISQDKPTEPRTYQYKFKKILKDAGIEPHNFHILRHTFATNCIAGGADIKSLSEILGHSSVNITLNRYVHPSIDTKRTHLNNLSDIYGQYLCQTS